MINNEEQYGFVIGNGTDNAILTLRNTFTEINWDTMQSTRVLCNVHQSIQQREARQHNHNVEGY